MGINTNKNNGITLIVLVITILILGILTSVTVTVTKENFDQTKKYNFSYELEIIQQKMLIINKEIQLGSDAYNNIGIKYDNLDDVKKQKVGQILDQNGITDYSKYIYMSQEDLLKIGLKNIKQNVIISNENSIVYSYDGINIDGKIYYSIEEINKL